MGAEARTLQMPLPNKKLRVAQRAMGRIGESSPREIIRSSQSELVGVHVHSDATAGITAYRVRNAVPFACAAEPGICRTVDLHTVAPQMV